ncbi:MAG: HAD family hydrolase [Oscillospiraceae bacterium]
MKYKACIFDFDLTLADSSVGIIKCFKLTLKEFGYPIPEDKKIFSTIGMTLVNALDELTGIPNNPQREQMRERYVKIADKYMVQNTVFFDDTVQTLDMLRSKGIKVGIVSSKMKYRIVDSFSAKVGRIPVDVIIGGSEVKNAKPDPEGLNLMSEKLGIAKSDILYIGDSYIDAETAMNAGVDFAGTTTGTADAETFEKYPHIYIGKNLTDIFAHFE